LDATLRQRRLAEQTGNTVRLAQAQLLLQWLQFRTGEWDDALAEVDVFDAVDEPYQKCQRYGTAAVIEFHRGRPGQAQRYLAAAEADATRSGDRANGLWTLAGALAQEVADRPGAALTQLATAIEAGSYQLGETLYWLPAAVRLAVALDEHTIATSCERYAAALHDQALVPSRSATALHCRGLLKADPDLIEGAAQQYGTVGHLLAQAEALHDAALLMAGRKDVGAARDLAARAVHCYATLGATRDVARLRAGLRGYGIHLASRATRRRPNAGWESLSPTESTVAIRVAQGQSNPMIAEELFLSRRTVESHVAHILAKLGMRSRVEIAAEVGRRTS
jgi:DNA-binding CsgD family transcriptional regulator